MISGRIVPGKIIGNNKRICRGLCVDLLCIACKLFSARCAAWWYGSGGGGGGGGGVGGVCVAVEHG